MNKPVLRKDGKQAVAKPIPAKTETAAPLSFAEMTRKLFAGNCDFMRAIADLEQCPPGRVPEIALIGRSNVGKSSLLNAITGRKALARASRTPGRTQQIVFFDLGGRLTLVDLPGYGHAKAPNAQKNQWNTMVQQYLQSRPNLKLVCLLIDGRHGAVGLDEDVMGFLDRAAISYQVVLTKSDLIRKNEPSNAVETVTALLPQHVAARPELLEVSSENKLGIVELQGIIAAFADPPKPRP